MYLFATYSSQINDLYDQLYAHKYTYLGKPKVAQWPVLPVADIISVDSARTDLDSFLALTSAGLFQYNESAGFVNVTSLFPGVPIGQAKFLVALSKDTLFLVNTNSLSVCSLGRACKTIATNGQLGAVYEAVLDAVKQRVFLACDDGLYQVQFAPSFAFAKVPIAFPQTTVPEPFLHVCVDQLGHVAASTEDLVFRTLVPADLTSFHFFRVPGIIDSSPSDMKFDKRGSLWIVNDLAINVQQYIASLIVFFLS